MVTRADLPQISAGADALTARVGGMFAKRNEQERDEQLKELLLGRQEELQQQRQAANTKQTIALMDLLKKGNPGEKYNVGVSDTGVTVGHSQAVQKDPAIELAKLQARQPNPNAVRQQSLASEGEAAVGRLKRATEENPYTAKAVAAGEQLRNIPLVGNLAAEGALGLTNLINPQAQNIASDRERAARNMTYIKSGAQATEQETKGIKRQMPGITAGTEASKDLYDTFAQPFRDITQQGDARPPAASPSGPLTQAPANPDAGRRAARAAEIAALKAQLGRK